MGLRSSDSMASRGAIGSVNVIKTATYAHSAVMKAGVNLENWGFLAYSSRICWMNATDWSTRMLNNQTYLW